MIPQKIVNYLERAGVRYQRHPHPRAITAPQLAEAAHVRGAHVAKTVLLSVDGAPWMAVLPANESVQPARLAEILGARRAHLLAESRFAGFFPDCEPGAEPPFGSLYGLPTVVDPTLSSESTILFRAGAHDEALEMSYDDYVALEHPRIAEFGVPRYPDWRAQPEYP